MLAENVLFDVPWENAQSRKPHGAGDENERKILILLILALFRARLAAVRYSARKLNVRQAC